MALPSYLKIEEIPVIAKFLYNSLTRDKDDFRNYAETVFTEAYLTAYLAKITEVETLTGLLAYWAQMSRITKDLYINVKGLRPTINKIEGYVNLAKKTLSIDPEKFGIRELRIEIKEGNVEGILNKMELILQNAKEQHNNAALTAKGMKPDLLIRFTGMKTAIAGLNEQQKLKRTEKAEAIKNNWGVIMELWNIAEEVIAAGKALYRVENKERVKDYTLRQLKKQVDAERKGETKEPTEEKGILTITVTNKSDDKPLAEAEFEIVETGYKDVTDEEGEGTADVKAGTYTVKVRMDGFKEVIIQNVIIKKDETTELAVALEAIPVTP